MPPVYAADLRCRILFVLNIDGLLKRRGSCRRGVLLEGVLSWGFMSVTRNRCLVPKKETQYLQSVRIARGLSIKSSFGGSMPRA